MPDLMTSGDAARTRSVVARAMDAGIRWFDTAATYGDGRSESGLGAALRDLGAADRVQVATKVRVMPDQLHDIRAAIRESVRGSFERLGVSRITLLQVHNSITAARGDEPTSITPRDVLGPGGMLEAFRELQAEGRVLHFGLTGIGQPAALREVIRTREFAAIQIPFHLLNPSAGFAMPAEFRETDYGNVMADCAAAGMAVFPIRVFAGGALTGKAPSAHTHKTKFFPLDLYQRDAARAARLRERIGGRFAIEELAVRFALSHPAVMSAIIGFGSADEVDQAVRYANAGPLPDDVVAEVVRLASE